MRFPWLQVAVQLHQLDVPVRVRSPGPLRALSAGQLFGLSLLCLVMWGSLALG
ncbi:MAG: hypothetical protein AAFV53_26725 [Myxococcota bacterium]